MGETPRSAKVAPFVGDVASCVPTTCKQGIDLSVIDGSDVGGSVCVDMTAVPTTNKITEEDSSVSEEDFEEYSYACCRPELWCTPENRCHLALLKLGSCVLAGIVFGWCLEKGRVFEPSSIRLQMVFERWIMLKMFLAAVASGQFAIVIISVIPRTKPYFERAKTEYQGCFSTKGIVSSGVGAFTLGAGMTLCGACPGMVLAQVGAWTKNSIFTLIGLLVGTLLYGMLAPQIVRLTRPKNPIQIHTVYEKFKVPYAALATPMCVLIIVTVFLMEWFIPWEGETKSGHKELPYFSLNSNSTPDSTNIFTLKSWPPSVCGVFIGLLQVVIIFAIGDTLGGSSSYVTIVSQWVVNKRTQEWFPYLARARCGLGNWWQVLYVSGGILGGLFSSLASGSLATTKGVSVVTAFFGGFLMLIGARFAAGCTSGHGLSGMALLFWLSIVAVPCMFAGGITVAFSMKATGALYDWKCFEGYEYMCQVN